MNDKKKLLIAGGDLRQIYCGKYLAKSFDVSAVGFDSQYIPENINNLDFSQNCIFDVIVLPVPPVRDSYINTPFYKDNISFEKLQKYADKNTVIFGGKLNDDFKQYFSKNDVYDYMEREELNILNAVPSAEGAIQIALEELPVTLMDCKVLITGFGRIGKALVSILKGFGADITIMTRSVESRAWAKVMNVNVCSKEDIDDSYNLIFNTAPVLIFDSEYLKKLNPDVLIIDLASKPGGVDFKTAGESGIKVIWALGLPGKSAPITSGEIIAQTIEGIISERSDFKYD